MSIKVLNLYAGLGANRKLWTGVDVTAVEMQPSIAAAYAEQHPQDTLVEGDAHQYLLDHYQEFQFIWSSPPCQSHSKMDRANCRNKKRYPDLRLYEEIIFLRTYVPHAKWVVENVVPYYTPLIPPSAKVGRHLFWTNFPCDSLRDIERPKGFIASSGQATASQLKEWLGIQYTGNIYYQGNHFPAQVLRNCVHPELGLQLFDASLQHTAQ